MSPFDEVAEGGGATSRHIYPASAMLGDYLRAAAGLVPAGVLFATVPVGTVSAAVLGSFAAIFAVFGVRTVLRHGTSLEMSEAGLYAYGPRHQTIDWAELDRMKLAYYSTRRDRRSGWMQLELRAGGGAVKLDSRIEGFGEVVRRAAEAAAVRGLALSEATVANLEALGVRLPEFGGAAVTDLLHIDDLHVRFATPGGFIQAVKGVSFRMRPASTLAVVGESGSGKSVVSQSILRILPRNGEISRGRILFADPRGEGEPVDLVRLPADGTAMRAIRGGRVSIIFQEPMSSLSPLHTIGDQISEALRLHRSCTAGQAKELTIEMLRLVGFPDGMRAWRSYPFELSGGLRQRAMIAMALVCRPALLIADEPTTALDVTIQAQILKLIAELQQELGMAVLLITHDLGVVANVAEEIVVMYRGEIMESGTLDDIFGRAEHPYLRALLRAVPHFDMQPGERLQPIREIPPGDAPHLMGQMPAWPKDASGPLLECIDLHKSFGLRQGGMFRAGSGLQVKAVDGVSLRIARGECLGLVGESGCGKTTLSKLLLRALLPDSGSVTFSDRGVATDVLALDGDALKAFRRQVQFIFQDPFGSLNPRMSVAAIIAEPLVIHGIGDARSRRDMVAELVGLVGLDERDLRRYPHSFSGGQRQRIGIARALALRPELVICDEPVSALDVSIQAQILNLLIDLQKKLGLTYLFISHNLAVVDYIADRIAVMCAGRIVEVAPRGVLFRAPLHPYTEALLAAIPVVDPAHHLDLHHLMEERASDPTAWPEPFRRVAGREVRLIEATPGHWVEASAIPRLGAMPEASLAGPG